MGTCGLVCTLIHGKSPHFPENREHEHELLTLPVYNRNEKFFIHIGNTKTLMGATYNPPISITLA